MKEKKFLRFIFFVVQGYVLLQLTGCVSVEKVSQTTPPVVAVEPQQKTGVYHKVNKGETIWRIAKAYNLSADEIVKSNSIPNVAQIEVNQLIFIPGATEIKKIPTISADLDPRDFVWPVKGKVISYFNNRWAEGHSGIDIETQDGEVVRAARAGEVVLADRLIGQDGVIIIDHQDGFHTVYAQNAKLLVGLNQKVAKNDPIAYVGKKNNKSVLHFEVRQNAKEDNPLYYLP